MSSPKKHTFFKFFLPEHSANRMKIPPPYRKHMNGKNSGTVYLRGPSRKYWRVKLLEESENLYLARGWPEFVKDHGIQLGYFLSFKFDGDSTFKVMAFNSTACEDKAALRAEPSRGNGNNQHITGQELVLVAKAKEEDACDEAEEDMEQARKLSALTLPHFTAQLKHHNVDQSGGITVGIPSSFAKTHLLHFVMPKTPIVLQWEDKAWPATVTITSVRFYVHGGWRDFMMESGVQKGDICKFELVDQFVLRVDILKRVKEE